MLARFDGYDGFLSFPMSLSTKTEKRRMNHRRRRIKGGSWVWGGNEKQSIEKKRTERGG